MSGVKLVGKRWGGQGHGMALLNDTDGSIWNMTTTVENDDWVLIVDATMLSLTIVGALSIIGSMAWLEYKGRPSTTRMRIVQSLVLSDLCLGITGLISVSMALAPMGLHKGSSCNGLGTVLVATLWTEHLWTLALAIATFMILIYPLHGLTLWLEKRWYLLWLGVWVVSIAVGVLGLELYGYGPTGGICYYPSTAGLYAELMQFIPRGMVFVAITFLYAKLFVFLRRPDKIRSPYSESFGGDTSHHDPTFLGFRTRRISSIFKKGKGPPPEMHIPIPTDQPVDLHTEHTPYHDPSGAISPLSATTPMTEIPPWERMELPVFQVDGQRFGGAAANTPTGGGSSNPWGNWKGLNTGVKSLDKKRSSTSSSTSARKFGSGSTGAVDGSGRETPKLKSPRLESIPSMTEAPTIFTSEDPLSLRRQIIDAPRKPSTLSDPGLITPTPSIHLADAYDPQIRRPSVNSLNQSTRRSSAVPTIKEGKVQPSLSERGSSDLERQRTMEEEEDDNWDLMRILQQSAPKDAKHRDVEETVELVEESMASYLNRKTALLMLWFPLGYCLLFSVSVIRIIYDFVGTPPVALRAISRWFIFAQGILDALIYGLVEWHTKRVVRKRVRRGTFSPSASRNSTTGGIASAFRALASSARRSGNATPMQSRNGFGNSMPGSQTGTRMGNTVSFGAVMEIDDPRSIHQALEDEDVGAGNAPGRHLGYLGEKRGSASVSVDTRDTKVSGSDTGKRVGS